MSASTDVEEPVDPTAGTPDQQAVLAAAASTAPISGGIGDYTRTYVQRVRAGDLGALPAVVGLVLLSLIFSVAHHPFFSLGNFANLTTQAAPSVVLAMGLIFVLLLGEIDLSAGTASGVCGASAAVMIHNGFNWVLVLIISIVIGAVIGLFLGLMRSRLGVPSFVVSLALFLGLQGVVLIIVTSAHTSGNLNLENKQLAALENDNMPIWLGWTLAVIFILGYAFSKLNEAGRRRSQGLVAEPQALIGIKIGSIAVLLLLATYLLSQNRALNQGQSGFATVNGKIVKVTVKPLEGVPWCIPFVVLLFVGLTFVLRRTRYGRHVYAVGGSDEAARRAGIRVDLVRTSVFVICSAVAAFAGILYASQTGVNSGQGSGTELLLAVGAAVIGGTSLFGGKGRIVDAVIGGLVVAVILNGMADLIQGDNSQAVKFIVTGIVLLLAATVDALSRRRAGASGLG